MSNFLKTFASSFLFFVGVWLSKAKRSLRPKSALFSPVSQKQTREEARRARYLMHSQLKAGDTYALGTATVTLAKFGKEGKAEVANKIAAADERRAKRRKDLTEWAEKIMLMGPEEILEARLDQWMTARKNEEEKIQKTLANNQVPEEIMKASAQSDHQPSRFKPRH